MSKFIDLFNGNLEYTKVFDGGFNKDAIFGFLKGLRDDPKKYLPNTATNATDASKVAGAFINDTTNTINGIITKSPIDSPIIIDIGTALAYLFDTQKPASQSIEDGYRPILHVYGRFMKLCSSTMTVIMFDSTTERFHYGSTITKIRNAEDKDAALKERFTQLKTAMDKISATFPTLPPMIVRALSKHIAGVRVPEKAEYPETEREENILQLYDPWITTLVASTSGSYPMKLTFTTDQASLEKLKELMKAILDKEEDKFKQGVEKALEVTESLKNQLELKLKSSPGSEYGHCAETYPFINLINDQVDKKKCQGLAMNPCKMKPLDADGINKGPKIYNEKGVFRKTCLNCASLVERIGMDPVLYNDYLNTVVTTFDTPT